MSFFLKRDVINQRLKSIRCSTCDKGDSPMETITMTTSN